MGALRYRPRRCGGEILNFGRGHPENVGELIRLLEKELDKKAIIVRRRYFRACSYFVFRNVCLFPRLNFSEPTPNIEESTLKIGYQPTVSLEKGLLQFS